MKPEIIYKPVDEIEYLNNIRILQEQEPHLTIDEVEYLEMVRDFHQYDTWIWI